MPDTSPTQLLDAYAAAVWTKDVDALMALYDPAVVVFDAWGVWSYDSAAAWRKAVQNWLGSLGEQSVKVSFEDVVERAGADLATLSATVTYAGVSPAGEVVQSMQNRLSWALARKGGDWRIVHEHTSAPAGFDDMKAILRKPS
jgi:ketosteroid isomerase-like protein